MKGMDIFCASQGSTSICLSHHIMDLPTLPPSSSSSSSTQPPQLGGRAIDRHNPIIQDPRRLSFQATITPTLSAPCSSSQVPPINPTPYHQLQKPNINPLMKSSPASDTSKKPNSKSKKKNKKKSSKSSSVDGKQRVYHPHPAAATLSKSAATFSDFITPPGSSRYLLGDPASFDGMPDYNDPILGLVPLPVPQLAVHDEQQEKDDKSSVLAAASKISSSSRFNKSSPNQAGTESENTTLLSEALINVVQLKAGSDNTKSPDECPGTTLVVMDGPKDEFTVVVLKVSLHCKGCEGKLRKHLSRMEGVTSFSIDFVAKKVTVVGDVTPLSVLASVSKVKNAQFWTSAPSVISALSSDHNKK